MMIRVKPAGRATARKRRSCRIGQSASRPAGSEVDLLRKTYGPPRPQAISAMRSEQSASTYPAYRQGCKVARLVDQRRRLVGQHRDLIVDLLQLARGGEHVLAEVGRVVDDPLRRGGRHGDGQGE